MKPPRFWLLLELVGILASLTLLLLSLRLDPDPRGLGTHEQLGLPACGYLERTGKPCLSCGMTTAFAHMAALSPRSAFVANPMGAILFVCVLVTPFWLGHALWTGQDPLRFARHPLGRFLLPGLILGCLWLFWVRS